MCLEKKDKKILTKSEKNGIGNVSIAILSSCFDLVLIIIVDSDIEFRF